MKKFLIFLLLSAAFACNNSTDNTKTEANGGRPVNQKDSAEVRSLIDSARHNQVNLDTASSKTK